jgi:diguanylate cyclase (GGDEF)-like protein
MLQSQLREQAIRDALTNLFNRRYLEETLERKLACAARESYLVCGIVMDLNYFKDVNDTCGHEAGERLANCRSYGGVKILRNSEHLHRSTSHWSMISTYD